jgi:hypothetical protein
MEFAKAFRSKLRQISEFLRRDARAYIGRALRETNFRNIEEKCVAGLGRVIEK